jgi:hypothetical protein
MLSRPIDTDSKQATFPPMEKGFFKWQVKGFKEWGSNKDLNGDKAQVNVLSIRWDLQCVEDPRYDGTTGGRPQKRFWFTTYWASDDKIDESYQKSVNRFLSENPTAGEDDVAKQVRKWKPQINLFEFLFACGLMEKKELDQQVEYVPVGWDISDVGQACTAAINTVVYGKIDKQKVGDREYPDSLVHVSQVKEK